MGRKPITNSRELSWYEASQVGQIYVSSEVILYSHEKRYGKVESIVP